MKRTYIVFAVLLAAITASAQTKVMSSGELQLATRRAQWQAVLRHPMMSLMVIVRIHWHALQLWLKRVPFFSKPHPPHEFVSR